jgi:GR25 family glycosyltransferase involved in LPS biosynthesis
MKYLGYYTCFFGGNDNYSCLIPPIPSESNDCYYFTNNQSIYDALNNTKWIRIFMNEIPIYNDDVLDAMSSKELRSCPHHFEILNNYEYLCWFDTKLKVFDSSVNNCIIRMNDSNKTVALTKHPYSDKYTSVWDEYNAAIQYEKYCKQKDNYNKYIKKQLESGFSEKIHVFYCGGFSIRKNSENVKDFNEFWFHNIKECGIEYQISLQFVEQKFSNIILELEYQETWKYFYECLNLDKPTFLFNKTNTFCVSVLSHQVRWEKQVDRFKCAGLDATRWLAATPENGQIVDNFWHWLTPLQKACSQSHLNIWKHLLNSNDLEYAFILEDDACFDFNWKQKMQQFFTDVNDPEWDMILLNASEPIEPINKWVKITEQYLTGGYILSKKGAKTMIQMFENNYAASDWMTSRLEVAGHSYSYFPWLIIQEGIETTVGSNVDADHQKVLRCLSEINYDINNYN